MSHTQPSVDHAVQFRDRLISVLAHETKGLFANIFWLIEMIENNLTGMDTLQHMLPELKSIVQKNLDDYTDTLSWIKAQHESFEPKSVKINIYGLFSQLHEFFKKQLAAKKQQLIFEGDGSINFFSDEILVKLILKKIIESILNISLPEKMLIFKISKSTGDKKICIKITGNDTAINKIAFAETLKNQIKPMIQMSEEINIDLQFAVDIASVLNGTLNVAELNNETTITLTLPLD